MYRLQIRQLSASAWACHRCHKDIGQGNFAFGISIPASSIPNQSAEESIVYTHLDCVEPLAVLDVARTNDFLRIEGFYLLPQQQQQYVGKAIINVVRNYQQQQQQQQQQRQQQQQQQQQQQSLQQYQLLQEK